MEKEGREGRGGRRRKRVRKWKKENKNGRKGKKVGEKEGRREGGGRREGRVELSLLISKLYRNTWIQNVNSDANTIYYSRSIQSWVWTGADLGPLDI